MAEASEIPVDIAKTLTNHLPEDRQTVVRVGPEGSPISSVERPTVYLVGCDEGIEVVWYDPAGASRSAYECGYDSSEKAVELINKAIEGINRNAVDSIPIEFEGNEDIIEEIIRHLDFDNDEDVEIHR